MNLKNLICTKLQKIEKVFHRLPSTNNLKSNKPSPRLIPIKFKPSKAINNIKMISNNQMKYPFTQINNLLLHFPLLLLIKHPTPPILQQQPKLWILTMNHRLNLKPLLPLINQIIMTKLPRCRGLLIFNRLFQNDWVFAWPASLSFRNLGNLFNFDDLVYFLFVFWIQILLVLLALFFLGWWEVVDHLHVGWTLWVLFFW